MKKIVILTSLSVLAACGGSGSGGIAGVSGLSPTESNARITGMNSFIVIGGSNPTINPNVRAATTGTLQPDGGIRFDLENVTFKSIPTSGVIADLIFHTDNNGKIQSIEFPDAESIMQEHSNSSVFVGRLKRQGDTNIFVSRPGQIPNMNQTSDMQIAYNSYAEKRDANGQIIQQGPRLAYADFGLLEVDSSVLVGADEDTIYVPFMGGFDRKNVVNNTMKNLAQTGDVEFTGLVKGQVSYSNRINNTGINELLEDRQAKLVFADDGTQTLTADFDNWAKISAVKLPNEKNKFIVHESYIDNEVPYYLAPNNLATAPELDDGAMVGQHSMTFQTAYYGDDNIPNEGVGLVQYQYMSGDNSSGDYEHHINVDLGFGGTR